MTELELSLNTPISKFGSDPQAAAISPGTRKSMLANRSKDTKPELAVRRMLHAMGYRFRLHRADLPGKPDIVFPKRRKIVLVHGCFWHQHGAEGCRGARVPKARNDYWAPKLARNAERDARTVSQLTHLGWGVFIVWECWLKDNARTFSV